MMKALDFWSSAEISSTVFPSSYMLRIFFDVGEE